MTSQNNRLTRLEQAQMTARGNEDTPITQAQIDQAIAELSTWYTTMLDGMTPAERAAAPSLDERRADWRARAQRFMR